MQPQLIRAVQRYHHGDRDHAACLSRQAGAGPDFSPGVARDQILKRRVEFILPGFRSLHVRLAQHLFADFPSLGVPFAVIHPCAPWDFRKANTSRLNSSRASMLERCAAGSSAYFAPGICSLSQRPSAGGVAGSCAPALICVATSTAPSFPRKSASRTAQQLAAYPAGLQPPRIESTCAVSPGCAARKPAVSQRSITAPATAFIPPACTAVIRAFQTSGVPIFAAVLHRTIL